MKSGFGMKVATALWCVFAVFFSYAWISSAIREHWPFLRWLALIAFIALFIGPLFFMGYSALIRRRKQ
jgi:hypothetical protein